MLDRTSNLEINESLVASARSAVSDVLGLELSDTEVEALLSDRALSLHDLAQNRSLSQIGTALIRADAMHHSSQNIEALKGECPEACFKVGRFCICTPFSPPGIELRLHQESQERI